MSPAPPCIRPADAVPGNNEYDVDLEPARNLVTVTVTAEDGMTTRPTRCRSTRG